MARRRGASGIHLEPGLPPTIRVKGHLEAAGAAIDGAATETIARGLISEADWDRQGRF